MYSGFKAYLYCLALLACVIGAQSQNTGLQTAQSLLSSGDYEQAYQQLTSLKRTLANQADRLECDLYLAQCCVALGALDEAVQLSDQALAYAPSVSTEKLPSLLMTKASALLKLGQNEEALKTLQLAESSLPDPESLEASQCYNDLGVVFWNTYNRETATNYHERALKIRQNKLPETDPLIGDSYLNLGLIWLETDPLQSIFYLNKSMEIYQKAFGQDHPKLALTFSNLALAYAAQGNYAEAIAYLDLNLKIWDSEYTGDHPNKAFTLSSKGKIYQEQGDLEQALLMQESALQQYLRLYGPKHPEVANTYYLIGAVYQKKDRFTDALENYQRSVFANLADQEYATLYDQPKLEGYFSADILLTSLQSKALILEAIHFEKSLRPRDINAALATYRLCDELIADIRKIRLNEADKIRLGQTAATVYDRAIRLAVYLSEKTLMREHYLSEAFYFCERSKSATLLEAIQATSARQFAGIPEALLRTEDSLKTQVSMMEQQLASAKSELEMQQVKDQLFASTQAYRQFVASLEKDFPRYYQLKYDTKTATVSELRGALPPAAAALAYFLGEESVFIFYVSATKLQVTTVPKNEQLAKNVRAFRNAMKYRLSDPIYQIGRELYSQLIPKIESDVNQLLILPDGILGTLPWEALVVAEKSGESSFLLEKYAVSYDFAATLFVRKALAKAPVGEGILLAAPVQFSGNAMAALPGSEREVKEIRYLFLSSPHTPAVQLRQAASESLVKNGQLSQYKFIHLATHGIVDEAEPRLSRVYLAPDGSNDGHLYAGEIYNLSIGASLVALSACETGLGKVERGEGIIGLSRALTYAGAQNLVVSLWQVADESTSQLMIEFYRQHLTHPEQAIFSADLRRAKLSLLRGGSYAHPYYWAPFILIGQ